MGTVGTYSTTPVVVEAATFLLRSLTGGTPQAHTKSAVDAVVDEGALDAVLAAAPLDSWCDLTVEQRRCGCQFFSAQAADDSPTPSWGEDTGSRGHGCVSF